MREMPLLIRPSPTNAPRPRPQPQKFWHVLNSAVVAMGFVDLFSKFKLPALFMLFLGHLCDLVSYVTGKKLKLNVFAVKVRYLVALIEGVGAR